MKKKIFSWVDDIKKKKPISSLCVELGNSVINICEDSIRL